MTWLITLAVTLWVAIKTDRSAQEAEAREWDVIMGTEGDGE